MPLETSYTGPTASYTMINAEVQCYLHPFTNKPIENCAACYFADGILNVLCTEDELNMNESMLAYNIYEKVIYKSILM